jgi:hypothetical protein
MKSKSLSRIEANNRLAIADQENLMIRQAFSDQMAGKVKWFGAKESFRIGVARPRGALAGIAVVMASGMVTEVRELDDYSRFMLAHIQAVITGQDNEHNKSLLEMRKAIQEAVAYRDKALLIN